MFGMSMTEILIILVVALILLGPDDLPKAAKTIGKTIRDLQRAGDDLRETFEREVMQEPQKPKGPPPGAISAGAVKNEEAKGEAANQPGASEAAQNGQASAPDGARPSLALAPPPEGTSPVTQPTLPPAREEQPSTKESA